MTTGCTCTRTCSPRSRTAATPASGEALKLAQRAQALDQGIDVVRWTFDPMVARNAWLNLGKLGVVVDRFARSFYGDMSDAINQGERSDRVTVAWHLRPRAGAARRRRPTRSTWCCVPRTRRRSRRLPSRAHRPRRAIEVPAEYHDLRVADPELGAAWRDAVAGALERCLDAGHGRRRLRSAPGRRTSSPHPTPSRGAREPDPRDRAVPGGAAARAAVPRLVRDIHGQGVRARPRPDRRRGGLGRMRRRRRLPRVLGGVERGRVDPAARCARAGAAARRRRRDRHGRSSTFGSCAATRWRRRR